MIRDGDDSQSRDRKIKGKKDGEVESRMRGCTTGITEGEEQTMS